jgi:hypothetical protein
METCTMLLPERTLALKKYELSGLRVLLHDGPFAYRSEDPCE